MVFPFNFVRYNQKLLQRLAKFCIRVFYHEIRIDFPHAVWLFVIEAPWLRCCPSSFTLIMFSIREKENWSMADKEQV